MKKISIIAAAFCLCAGALKAQYIVTKVAGQVKNQSGEYVHPGSELQDNTQLSWSSLDDKLWVVITGRGEKIISPSSKAIPGDHLFTEVLASSIQQNSRSGALSGRGEIVEKLPDALRTNMAGNNRVVIENENKFLFDPKQYPQGNAGVFFLEIDAPQKAPVIRTLTAVNDTLMINYPDFATETSDAATRYSLGYHDKTSANHDQLVVSFEPYFDQVNEMEAMVANTIRAYAAVTAKDAVRDSVYRNVYANSGKPNGLLFTELFDKYWANKGIMAVGGQPGGTGSVFDEQTFLNVPKLSASVGATRDELPANFSLRQYAPPIGNQGQYGSCVAWSTAYACRTIAFAVDHGYSINNHYELIKNDSFAPDFIYNNIRTSADCNSGTSLAAALAFMKNNGNLLKAGDFICGKNYTPADLNGATPYKIKDFLRVNDPGMAKADMIQKMKSMLVNKRALSFGMHTPPSFQHVAASGIWYPTDADRLSAARAKNFQEPYVGHAMCVVGYNDAINNGSFEVMNSWGTWNGNLGFYWINYDDFYRFTNEVYAIEDFPAENPPAPAPSPAPVLAPIFVNIPPVVKTNIPPAPAVIVAKPKLKGSMEFMQLKTNNSFETIPVTKKQIGTRGQVVEGDNTADGYANFVLTKPMHSGDRYKIKFNVGSPAYVYVIGMDKESNYTLFPQKSKNESALVNIKNTNLFLPNDSAHYTLDNVTGKEKMCILVSKSPISVDELNKAYASADHNLYQAVRNSLNKRLVEMKAVDYVASGSIGFDTVVNDNNVLAFFIEIEHL